MYLTFFGFHKKPFSVTPDPSFFFPGESHRQGLSHLRYGIRERVGFIALTGEVGTGKTHLVRLLLQELGPEVKRALILNPVLGPDDLLTAIMQDLEVAFEATMGLREKLEAFVEFLLKEHQEGRRVLVIIDESHNLSIQSLERLRLLSNLETAGTKLVQILLVGQPELNLLLNLPPLRSLNQRISVRHHLESLTSKDTEAYIRHRLVVAGGQGVEVAFTRGAARMIHRSARGVPRVVSTLCDFCLVIAFTEESSRITPKMAREAIRLHRSKATPSEPKRMERTYRRRALIPALAGAMALIAGIGLTGWNLMKTGHGAHSPAPTVSVNTTFLSTDVEGPGSSTLEVPQSVAQAIPPAEPDGMVARAAAPPALPVQTAEPDPAPQEVSSFLVEVPSPPAPQSAPIQESIVGGSIIPSGPATTADADIPEEPPASSNQSDPWSTLPAQPKAPVASGDASNPTVSDGKRYGVQIASTKSIDKARSAAKGVSDFGPVYVVPTTSAKGSKWVKVVVGAFGSYDEALVLARQLNDIGKAKDACVVNNSWWKADLSGAANGVIVVESNPRVASSGAIR